MREVSPAAALALFGRARRAGYLDRLYLLCPG